MPAPAFHIRPVTLDTLKSAPEFAALCDQYRAEGARNPALLGAPPDLDGYRAAQQSGQLLLLALYQGEALSGFAVLRLEPVLHAKGKTIACTESLFAARAVRKQGAGRALLDACEDSARQAGACSLYVAAPKRGALLTVLSRRSGFFESARVFVKVLL